MKKSLIYAMLVITGLNYVFGMFCYYSFGGSNLNGNIVDNLDDGIVNTLVRCFLIGDLVFTYALFMFPITESLERSFNIINKLYSRVLRITMVALTIGVAFLVPAFELLTP
eukprot:UN08612